MLLWADSRYLDGISTFHFPRVQHWNVSMAGDVVRHIVDEDYYVGNLVVDEVEVVWRDNFLLLLAFHGGWLKLTCKSDGSEVWFNEEVIGKVDSIRRAASTRRAIPPIILTSYLAPVALVVISQLRFSPMPHQREKGTKRDGQTKAERQTVCVCVCVWERERERERVLWQM